MGEISEFKRGLLTTNKEVTVFDIAVTLSQYIVEFKHDCDETKLTTKISTKIRELDINNGILKTKILT